MSRRQQIMRMRLAPAVLGAAVALAVSGCGAGLVAQTSEQLSAVNGASADIGTIALRDAVLAYPGGQGVVGYREGQNAPLLVTIANSGARADELVSVTTPVSPEVTVEGLTTIAGASSVSSILDEDNPLRTSSPSTAPSRPFGRPGDGGELRIVLTDLRQPIRPGLPTSVTFRFREAGEVSLQVPVNAPAGVSPAEADKGAGEH
ncbi:MAG: hypothetical protein ACRDT0_17830 [Pseudonocardiaceae bacterium]